MRWPYSPSCKPTRRPTAQIWCSASAHSTRPSKPNSSLPSAAAFVVQPCATAEVAEVCAAHDIPWLPGALTPTEINQAVRLGAAVVKIFPGNAVGPDYVKSLRGPMPDVKLMVTGGVEPTEESLNAWFGAGVNAVGMGSQLFKDADDTDALAARIADLMQVRGHA